MSDCVAYVIASFSIPISYVALIYAFDNREEDKSHPTSLKKRFAAAVCNNIFAISLTFILLKWNYDDPFREMGFRLTGFFSAAILPSILTTFIYLGSLTAMFSDGTLREILSFRGWRSSVDNLLWIKYTLVGPISEEIAFRSCVAVLINHCYGWAVTTLICPLFFAISHFHHVVDDLKNGDSLFESLMLRAFQVAYTYLFGAYATFLFLRTGHVIAPIISHAICNSFGLPNLLELGHYPQSKRSFLIVSNIAGFLLWFSTVAYLTAPWLYV